MPNSLAERRPRHHPAMLDNEQNSNLAMNFYYGLTERSMPAAQSVSDTPDESANVKPVPEWLMLIPSGIVQGLDGRTWQNTLPQSVVDAFDTDGLDLPWDVEHATHIKGPQGEYAGAAGWIDKLEVRDGEVWGHIDWNDRGRWIIEDKDYKYYSPAFLYDDNGVITKIRSCGFTNDPNLADLPALNHKGGAMPIPKAIAVALGVTENADETSAVAAINTMRLAMNSRNDTVDLTKYVPRADYQLALNRAQTAEQSLSQHEGEQAQALVDKAIEDGKVAPSSRDMYLATCRSQEGREQFKQFVGSAQSIAEQQAPNNNSGGEPGALSTEELAMCRQLNLSEEDFKKSKESLALN